MFENIKSGCATQKYKKIIKIWFMREKKDERELKKINGLIQASVRLVENTFWD